MTDDPQELKFYREYAPKDPECPLDMEQLRARIEYAMPGYTVGTPEPLESYSKRDVEFTKAIYQTQAALPLLNAVHKLRIRRRITFGVGVLASLVLGFVGGWYLGPAFDDAACGQLREQLAITHQYTDEMGRGAFGCFTGPDDPLVARIITLSNAWPDDGVVVE